MKQTLKKFKSIYHFLAAHFGALAYGNPSQKIFVVGVTGTKGKTTTTELLSAGLEAAGYKTAISSSYRQKIGSQSHLATTNSMPGRSQLQKFLSEAVKEKCDFAIIEVTSEGVVQHRHRGIDFNAGIFLGIHPEHLESHGSFTNYRDAKLSFFKYIKSRASKNNPKLFFINAEDWSAKKFVKELRSKNTRVTLFMRSYLPSKLSGVFNQINVGAAESFLMTLGIGPQIIKEAFKNFEGIPGRMEHVLEKPFKVVVDYAHTPHSLDHVYRALKNKLKNYHLHEGDLHRPKLICVLGSAGGGRDKWKRSEFGRLAGKYCDEIFLTSEDPYDEKPHSIIKDIEGGIPAEKLRAGKTHNIVDRKAAIKKAIETAAHGDTVIITGKGSEQSMHLAHGKTISWSDRKIVVEDLVTSRRLIEDKERLVKGRIHRKY